MSMKVTALEPTETTARVSCSGEKPNPCTSNWPGKIMVGVTSHGCGDHVVAIFPSCPSSLWEFGFASMAAWS